MRRVIFIVIAVVAYVTSNAQEYGAQWVFGCCYPAIIDFRNDTVANRNLPNDTFVNSFRTIANICDESGDLLYWTNGTYICDYNGDSLLNGGNLSPCPYNADYIYSGLNINQAALFLPMPNNSRYYYLFHYSADDTVNINRPATLYYSIIDSEGNGGLGEVIHKNTVFCTGHFREGGMTSCKHANGRDYWIIQGEENTNRFFEFLLTPDSILGPFIQSIGPVFVGGQDVAYSSFSQDGSKYATLTFESLVLVMDFDRCTGLFSNPVTFPNISTYEGLTSASGGTGVAFSPDNRFLYVTDNVDLHQYDLLSANINDSVRLYLETDSEPSGISFIEMGPNGKMYASTWSGGFYFFHVINNPDERGDSCDFVYGGQPTLSESSANVPNMINYKLGPLVGSACDTITGLNETTNTNRLTLYPNPANDVLNLVYYANFNGAPKIEMYNALGELVKQQFLDVTLHTTQFNTANFTNSLYIWRIRDNERIIQSGKVIIEH